MHRLHIFADGSVNSRLKVGYGAYFVVSDLDQSVDELQGAVRVKRFDQTSSTKLELQTVLWALNDLKVPDRKDVTLSIYTDCQNIIGLPDRRARLEANNYYSSKNKRLNNYELYQEFYQLTSALQCDFIKMVGHQVSHKKGKLDKLFELVDRMSRKALRENI